jgi:uncharacterized protein
MRFAAARMLAVAIIAGAAMGAASLAAAEEPGHMRFDGTILSVQAEGKVEGAPDMATVSLGVTTDGATAQAAMSANAQRMDALTRSLRSAGVAARDVQTAQISVNPQYVYEENKPPRLTGYQAVNTVNARVRNLDRLGRTLDAAIAAGGNTLNGVSFSYQNPDTVLDAARRDAIARARARATLYAEAAGLTVGRIVSINEGGGFTPPMPMPMPMMAMREASVATPVSPGEIQTTVTVNVVFELH